MGAGDSAGPGQLPRSHWTGAHRQVGTQLGLIQKDLKPWGKVLTHYQVVPRSH